MRKQTMGAGQPELTQKRKGHREREAPWCPPLSRRVGAGKLAESTTGNAGMPRLFHHAQPTSAHAAELTHFCHRGVDRGGYQRRETGITAPYMRGGYAPA